VRAGLLHDLLTRGLDAHGQLRDPIAHPEQFQDSPLGRIPKEWNIRQLGDLAEVDRGKFAHRPRNEPRFYGGRHPFVQTGDVANAAGEVLRSFTQTLNDDGAAISREFPANTIVITIAANIADTAILGRPMFLTDSVVGAVVKPPNSVRYVELCIRRAKPQLQARAPQTAQMNINLQDLRPLEIPVPSNPDEQHGISKIYEMHTETLRIEQANLEKLKQLKSGLMTDLLTGRVRVHW
jgi:type I restriction enzyme S subunit